MKSANRTPGARPGTEGNTTSTKSNVVQFTPKCRARLAPTARSHLWFENASEIRALVAEQAAAMNEPVPDKIFVVSDEIDQALLDTIVENLINERFQTHREPFAVYYRTQDGRGVAITIPKEG